MKTPTSGLAAKSSASSSFWIQFMEKCMTVVGRGMCVQHKDALLFCMPGATGVRLDR